MVGVSIEKKIL